MACPSCCCFQRTLTAQFRNSKQKRMTRTIQEYNNRPRAAAQGRLNSSFLPVFGDPRTLEMYVCCAFVLSCSQLVCLSATLPNIECLAKWLDASLYRTGYRPVELRHFVCKGRTVYRPRRVGTEGAERVGGGEGMLEKASLFRGQSFSHTNRRLKVSGRDG